VAAAQAKRGRQPFNRLFAGAGLAICSAVVVACSASGSLKTSPGATASVSTPVSSGSTGGVQADPTEPSSGTTVATSEAQSAATADSFLDDPTKMWGDKKVHLRSVAEATARLRSMKDHENVTAVEGKYIEVKPDDIVEMNGGVLLRYKKDRAYVSQDFTGYFSNAMAGDFIDEYGASYARLGRPLELIDLGSGFSGILAVDGVTASMRFGTDDRQVQVLAPSTPKGEAFVMSLSKALARELAEVSKPGSKRSGPRPSTTVPLPTTLEPLPVDSADPNPAKGIDPPAQP
jgi:hypothetical protein